MKIKVCDVCHKTMEERCGIHKGYEIKHKMFTPIYKNNGVKVEKLDVCESCMDKILKKITQNNEEGKDSIMGPPDRYLGVM